MDRDKRSPAEALDAARLQAHGTKGVRIESASTAGVVISEPARMTWTQHTLTMVIVVCAYVVTGPGVLVALGVWLYFAFGRRTRWELTADEHGHVQRIRLGRSRPAAGTR